MLESLIASEYLYENDEYCFKVKNLTESEKLDWYKKFEKIKEKNNNEINEEELVFEMYKELIVCSGKINLKEISFEEFLIFINSPYITDVANDLNRCITSLYMSIMKTGLLNEKIKLEELEMKAALLLVQEKVNDYIKLVAEQVKHKKQVKAELKRIQSIAPSPEIEKLKKVSKIALLKTKYKLNREIIRKEKFKNEGI